MLAGSVVTMVVPTSISMKAAPATRKQLGRERPPLCRRGHGHWLHQGTPSAGNGDGIENLTVADKFWELYPARDEIHARVS